MFYTADQKQVILNGSFKNQSCFLILSGPSLSSFDLSKLNRPGIITFGVNNSPRIFRPCLWTEVDSVQNFLLSIWLDPKIKKFVPMGKQTHNLFDNAQWTESHVKVSDCPNVFYYQRNDEFHPETFLSEDTVNWGCRKDFGGARSVMLAAIKIIYLLGFKNVFLLGADFKMSDTNKYAFPQDRSAGSIRSNNSAYLKLNTRLTSLKPFLEKAGFFIFNSTPDSGLKAFDYINYDDAVDIALKNFPDTLNERTEGMYDREAKLREIEFKKTHGIIYYNVGKNYLVRLAVSLSSLRKVYDGQVSILCDFESLNDCKAIADLFNADVIEVDFNKQSRNAKLFNKTILHKLSPYECSLYLDSDTIVIKDPRKLFKHADTSDFVATQFADWTPKTPLIAKRINEWKDIADVTKALEYPYAVNTGVFAFKKKSKLMRDWYDLAIKGEGLFIPDEISCQIMLSSYQHFTDGASFNMSCKYGSIGRRTAIIHYHGNKHCRMENKTYLYNSNIWYNEFDSIRKFDVVENNILFDSKLGENIGFHDSNSRNA
jgi:hypothetical protein